MENTPKTIDDVKDIFIQGLGKRLGLDTLDLKIGLIVAQKHMKKGEYLKAFRLFSALVLCDPNEINFQLGLADCALKLGEGNFALQAASAVVMSYPRDPRGYLLSGQACFMMGHLTEAQEDFEDAIKFSSQGEEKDEVVKAKARLFLSLISEKKSHGDETTTPKA